MCLMTLLKRLIALLITVLIVGTYSQSLDLDYQNITYNATNDAVSVTVNNSGSCSQLKAEFFTTTEILNGSVEFSNFQPIIADKNVLSLTYNQLSLNTTDPLFFRIVAYDNMEICFDNNSYHTYYRFDKRGIPIWMVPNRTQVKLDFPQSPCKQLFFSWPKLMKYNGANCFCLPYESSVYSFGDCVRRCGTDYSLEVVENAIFFSSPKSTSILAHFICEERPCVSDPPCVMVSILASYRLVVGATISEIEGCESGVDFIIIIIASVMFFVSVVCIPLFLVLLLFCIRSQRVYILGN